MRRVLAIAFLAGALFVPFAAGAANPPPFPKLGNFTHAEINVRIAKQPHTLILNLGRITAVDPGLTSITIIESDRSVWTIPLSPTTRITLYGRFAIASELHKRLIVETMQIDGGAAVRVKAVRIP